jgi:hypothetical protein
VSTFDGSGAPPDGPAVHDDLDKYDAVARLSAKYIAHVTRLYDVRLGSRPNALFVNAIAVVEVAVIYLPFAP